MIKIEKSRSGIDTAKINNIYFHSKYDPLKEAEKICFSEGLFSSRTIVLIEPGLNYISQILKSKQTHSKIITINIYKEFNLTPDSVDDFSFFYNNDSKTLKTFLSSVISEMDIESLKIIKSPAALKIDPEKINAINNTLLQHIREMHGNITTLSGFGQKYFRNFLKNYIHSESLTEITDVKGTIMVAGSGPSLSGAIDFIKRYRFQIILIALPSSMIYLDSNNITPDIVITTDPGYYAEHHLEHLKKTIAAAPFTASLPDAVLKSNSIFLFSQNHFLENTFLNRLHIPSIPSNGTVAGSAVFLACILGKGPVLISGLDFSYNDLISHNRPHTFDMLIDVTADRLSPIHNQYFKRNILNSERVSGTIRTNHALKTYSGWFSSYSALFNNRCFFLESNYPVPEGFKTIKNNDAASILSINSSFNRKVLSLPSREDRIISVKQFINKLNKSLECLIDEIKSCEETETIIRKMNNDIIINILLPELMELKRHFSDKNFKEVQDKAVSIIKKVITLINGFSKYA